MRERAAEALSELLLEVEGRDREFRLELGGTQVMRRSQQGYVKSGVFNVLAAFQRAGYPLRQTRMDENLA